ncbi:unnamed protein product [Eretmochelys imbricata]
MAGMGLGRYAPLGGAQWACINHGPGLGACKRQERSLNRGRLSVQLTCGTELQKHSRRQTLTEQRSCRLVRDIARKYTGRGFTQPRVWTLPPALNLQLLQF